MKVLNTFKLLSIQIILISFFSACSFKDDKNEVRVEIKTTMGNIELSLDEKKAPITVANFIKHANAGFYEATIFHRVIPGFMIQGGGLDRDMREKVVNLTIKNESTNGLSNQRGTIAMARTRDPDSATTQFFINLVDNQRLDAKPGRPGYAVFGKVTSGMDVVDKIAAVKTTSKYRYRDVPEETIEILEVKVLSKKENKTTSTESTQKNEM